MKVVRLLGSSGNCHAQAGQSKAAGTTVDLDTSAVGALHSLGYILVGTVEVGDLVGILHRCVG